MTTIFSHLELETTAPVLPYLLLWVVLCLITKLSSNVTKTHLQSDNLCFLNLKSHNLFHWSKSPSDEINLELCPTVELLITFGKRMSASSQTLQFNLYTCPDDRCHEERAESLQKAGSQMRTFPWSMPLNRISPAITEEPGAVTRKAP